MVSPLFLNLLSRSGSDARPRRRVEASEEPRERREGGVCCASEHTWGREGCGLSYSRAIPPVGEGPCGVFQTYGCLAAAPGGACRVGWVCKAGPQGFGGPPGNLPAGQGGEGAAAGGAGGGAPVVWDFSAGEKREGEGEGEEESRRRAAASVGAPLSPDCTQRALSGVPAVGAAA